MAEPGRVFAHAKAAGCDTVADYALELEDVLEAIVNAPDQEDVHAAVQRAQKLVWSWTSP